jgi:hypothetical protein
MASSTSTSQSIFIEINDVEYMAISVSSDSTTSPAEVATTVPTSPAPLHIRPRLNDSLVAMLEDDDDEPISPRSGYLQLNTHWFDLEDKHQDLLGKKAAKAGFTRAHQLEREKELIQATLETVRYEKSQLGRDWQTKVNALHQQLANVRAGHHSPTIFDAPYSNPPQGYEANDGRLPDFFISVKGGEQIQAPYIQRLIGAPLALGTIGGPNVLILAHDLFALPFGGSSRVPDVLPPWFVQILSSTSPTYDTLVTEALDLDDWGLVGDIERYHQLKEDQQSLQAQIMALQDQHTDTLHSIRLCHARLARADAGRRLASTEALCLNHQEGHGDSCGWAKRKGQGRPFVK